MKGVVAEQFGATLEQVCLIFAGKILKDQETLKQHNLKDGLTVHLVIKTGNRSNQETPNNPPATPSETTSSTTASRPTETASPFGGLGGLGGLAGLFTNKVIVVHSYCSFISYIFLRFWFW